MDSVLGRKQRIKNSDWIETFDKIEQLITKEELDQLVNKTIQDIKAKTKGKQAAYAWSGGKDAWSEIYEIDSSIVNEAAEYFESAKAFLKTIK